MASSSTRVPVTIKNNQSQGKGAKFPQVDGPAAGGSKMHSNGGKGSSIVKPVTSY